MAVSNHTYASIQRSGLSRYQALLDRNPSTHRYDEPTSEQTLGKTIYHIFISNNINFAHT